MFDRFDLAAALPFIISASLQLVATVFSAITTGIAESRLESIEQNRQELDYNEHNITIPKGSVYADFLPQDYRPKELSALYSWSRDLALVFASGVAITVTVLAASSLTGAPIKIACVVWWLLVVAAAYFIYNKGKYLEYADFRFRLWLWGPGSLLVVIANGLLVPAVGFGWLR